MSDLIKTVRWREATELPETNQPITALIAIKDADEGDIFLVGIHLWCGDGWKSEDTGRRLQPCEYWWLPEAELLRNLRGREAA